MPDRPITCALLTYFPYWPGEILLACRGIKLVALSPSAIGASDDRNPFGLPEDDKADVALVTAWWHRWLLARHPDRADQVMREVERRTDLLIALDGPDRFALTFPPDALARFGRIIKFQGIYRDRDLYNYVVGPQYPGANWTSKIRPQPMRYRTVDLEKLRLSLPCFVTEFPGVRSGIRAARESGRSAPGARYRRNGGRLMRDLAEAAVARTMGVGLTYGRSLDVGCLTGLSHVQRIEVLRLLHGLSGTRGIVATQGTAPTLISGTNYGGAALPDDVAREIVESARPFARPQLRRLPFLLDLRRHRVAVAPTGYGELTYRHGSALMAGAALVCQDLSHVDMALPLVDRENAVFCRPDLSDLRETVEELLRDDRLRLQVAANGRQAYSEWSCRWRQHLYTGLEAHIREALRSAGAPRTEGDASGRSA